MKSNYILEKDLPNCPKGRIFKPNFYGTEYFLSITVNESIENKIISYTFKADVVENNPDWFKKETKSDLRVQLENAISQKYNAEIQIKSLEEKLKNK